MSGKFALIIANTEYTDPGLAQLTAPGKDAEDFARVLKSQDICAFDDVKVLLNQPESIAREAIDEFFDQKKPDDLLVFYFSGHGVRDELGALYLAVKNTNRFRLRSTAVKSDFIREAMDQSRSKRQVLIMDCCNSGAFAQGTKAATGVSIGTATAFEAGYGRVILTASDSTQFAWEGDKVIGDTDNSLFTHFLVQGLHGEADADGDGHITVDELYDYAYEKVRLVTPKQTPSKFSSKQQGEIVLRQITRIEDIKPQSLPEELIEATEDSRTFVREGAVQQLEKLLNGRNLGLARSAREALERMEKGDDSRRVSQLATEVLEPIRQAEKAEEERKAREDAERLEILKAEEERLAREKAEAERKAKEEAERLAEEKRLALEQAEAERKAVEETERLLAEQKAAEERKAREEAERLLAEQKAEEERIARDKMKAERLVEKRAKAERKAKEEAERLLAEQKAEEERRAGEEADRLATLKAEVERLARERAEAERKPKQEAEQLASAKSEWGQEEVEPKAAHLKAAHLKVEHALTKRPTLEVGAKAPKADGKRKALKAREPEEFVYVIVDEGIPLFHSLPTSNNWTVWLAKGSRLTLTKPGEAETSIGKYGHYVEVSAEKGNEGYVAATVVSKVRAKREAAPKKVEREGIEIAHMNVPLAQRSTVMEETPFLLSLLGRSLLGGISGIIFGITFGLISGSSGVGVVVLVLMVACGLAGLIAYPAKASIGCLILGFLVVGAIMDAGYLDQFLLFGAFFGFPGGALISRILYWLKVLK